MNKIIHLPRQMNRRYRRWTSFRRFFALMLAIALTVSLCGNGAQGLEAAPEDAADASGMTEGPGAGDASENPDLSAEADPPDPTEESQPGAAQTFADLAEAAASGGLFTLPADMTANTAQAVAVTSDFTLDLNGHQLTCTGEKNVNLFNVTGTLTVKDSGSGGTIRYVNGDNIVSVDSGGTLELQSGTLTAEGCVRGVFSKGTVRIAGGSIDGIAGGGNGGGVFLRNGTLDMSGGSIKDNSASGNGGGICADQGSTIHIAGGEISGNTAAKAGGGIYAEGETSISIDGGAISGNTAAGRGGGVYAENLEMHGGSIENNTAQDSGGGIFAGRQLRINGGEISGNTALHVGGGIFLHNQAVGDITGDPGNPVYITGNTANDEQFHHGFAGGGIFVEHPDTTAVDEENEAKLYIYNVLVTGNTARYGGGVAGCGTSSVYVFSTEGVAIFDNYLTGTGTVPHSRDIYCDGTGVVDSLMLGDVCAVWDGSAKGGTLPFSSGRESLDHFYLTAELSDTDKQTARAAAGVIIEGNTSGSGGGGIGGNGYIRMGVLPAGSLTISKKVTADEGIQIPAGMVYTFTVTGPGNYEETVTITGEDSYTLDDLVPGTYTVTEDKTGAQHEGCVLEVSGEGGVTVVNNRTTEAVITNTYREAVYGSLTVKKAVSKGDGVQLPEDKTYTFTVTGPENYSETVEITGEGSETLSGLLPGIYTVTEDTAAAQQEGYRLTVSGSGDPVQVIGSEKAEITVTNTYTPDPGGNEDPLPPDDSDDGEDPPPPPPPGDSDDGEDPPPPPPPGDSDDGEDPPPPPPPGDSDDGEDPTPPPPPGDSDDGEEPTPPPPPGDSDDGEDPPPDDSDGSEEPTPDEEEESEDPAPPDDPERPVRLPDPNGPDAPETFVIWDEGVPTTYVRMWDPETEEWVWIPEDEIPQANMEIPATGDVRRTELWAVLSAASLSGGAVLLRTRRKEEKE